MKRERLDEILLRKGWVTEEQIKQSLMRQKSRGGDSDPTSCIIGM